MMRMGEKELSSIDGRKHNPGEKSMKLGVCVGPDQTKVFAEAGFAFVELHVQNHLKTMEDDHAFAGALHTIQSSVLPCCVANCFVPGSLKITGDSADMDALESYVTTALARAHTAGIDTIVFGSGGARQIPEGFDRGKAWHQLVDFGKMVGPIALQNKVTVVVEPLNHKECNVLNSVGETASYVEAVHHPAVRLLVDAYHMGVDNDIYGDIVTYGHYLSHVHIATIKSRRPPGLEPCDFTAFFTALRQAQYTGRISVEAGWEDGASEASVVYKALLSLTETL
ncbi:MAG: sugar phosphate isomerase/epimerase [Anaerolineales bacterium]|nr:MAG: sugar phosphate isomerase/epimerase [Anaerolineales bacterium]